MSKRAKRKPNPSKRPKSKLGLPDLDHSKGGELERIQFLLGHVSVQTTERYLGCKQRIRGAVNDRMGIEP